MFLRKSTTLMVAALAASSIAIAAPSFAATKAKKVTVHKYVVHAMGTMKGAEATGVFILNAKNDTIRYTLKEKGIKDITAAHIHAGMAGANGPVEVPLNIAAFTSGKAEVAKVTAATLDKILKDPKAFYFNVHTKADPAGVVRGQL